jgi:hypothetical protein
MAMMTVRGRAVLGRAMVARNASARKRPGRNPGYQIRDIKNGWLEDRSAAGLEVFAARSGRNHQTERRCVAAFNLARQAGPGPRI